MRKGFSAYELHPSVSSTPQLSLDKATYHKGHRLGWHQPAQFHRPRCRFVGLHPIPSHPIHPARFSITLKKKRNNPESFTKYAEGSLVKCSHHCCQSVAGNPKDTVSLHSNMGVRGNLVVSQWVTRSVMLLSHSKQPLSEQLP